MPFVKAIRTRTPLLVGLYGQTGSGKTYSALLLATGIARARGCRIGFVDTENGRALHYADRFDFDHLPLDPPFSSTRYLNALKEANGTDIGVVIIDSMTHEHTGLGGHLEQHDDEVKRMRAEMRMAEHTAQFPAWQRPKAVRRQLLDNLSRSDLDVILCFRAKERVRMPTKEERDSGQRQPIEVGLCPVGGEEFAYETVLFAGIGRLGKGVPDWAPPGERAEDLTKLFEQLKPIFKGPPRPFTVGDGEALSRWATGEAAKPANPVPQQQPVTEPVTEPVTNGNANDDSDGTFERYLHVIGNCGKGDIRKLVEGIQAATALSDEQREKLGRKLRERKNALFGAPPTE